MRCSFRSRRKCGVARFGRRWKRRASCRARCPAPPASSAPWRRSRCSIWGSCEVLGTRYSGLGKQRVNPEYRIPSTESRAAKRRLGVIGTFVWDVIHGRGPTSDPVEEWGGITYALSGLDAALSDDWEIVPLIKVGDDLVDRARQFAKTLEHMAPDAELIGVPYPNNRVELRYSDDERRTEYLTGGVPGWEWSGLKPVLDAARLDALYINFLSGWELDLEVMQLIRAHFAGRIYCDLHMLAWAVQPTGLRTLRPLSHVREWCSCF